MVGHSNRNHGTSSKTILLHTVRAQPMTFSDGTILCVSLQSTLLKAKEFFSLVSVFDEEFFGFL